jgi:hypothetical protein
MVGARGFEPPTPWSRSRPLKNYKCCVWCRLPVKTATNLPLELDGSWTENHTPHGLVNIAGRDISFCAIEHEDIGERYSFGLASRCSQGLVPQARCPRSRVHRGGTRVEGPGNSRLPCCCREGRTRGKAVSRRRLHYSYGKGIAPRTSEDTIDPPIDG